MSSQMVNSPRQELGAKRAETVERLFEAGEQELRAVGHDALTIRTVAARAGVSAATAYTYLASKNHLFAELFLRVLAEDPRTVTGDDPVERVRSVTRRMAELLAAQPELSAAVTPALLSSDPDIDRLRRRIGGEMVARFAAALGPDADPVLLEALALAFSGALLQAGMGLMTYTEMANRLDAVVAAILQGHSMKGHNPMTVIQQTPIVFDPYDYAFQDDPYPVYARMRAEAPLFHNQEQDFWAMTRHVDIAAAFRDDARFSNRMGVSIDRLAWHPEAHKTMSFLALDGKDQQRLRSLVSKAFTPRRVKELIPQIEALTKHYFDIAFQDGIEFDWIDLVAGRLPMDVISEMMGVPVEDRVEVRRQADLVVHREDGIKDVPHAAMESSLWLHAYYADMLAERRARPTQDLTSALLATEVDGDRLQDQEIIAFLFLMVVAGNETTTKLLGNALFHLAAHPEQQVAVLADPDDVELVTPWIEETLRHDTSSQMLARHLTADVEIDGVTAPAGSKMVLVIGSANRDETVFTEPTVFDIHRPKEELAKIVSFGGGRHFCLGANLARLEARIVLEELVRRVGHLHVDHARSRRVNSISVRGFRELPLTVELR